jgi:hypothetical protein
MRAEFPCRSNRLYAIQRDRRAITECVNRVREHIGEIGFVVNDEDPDLTLTGHRVAHGVIHEVRQRAGRSSLAVDVDHHESSHDLWHKENVLPAIANVSDRCAS